MVIFMITLSQMIQFQTICQYKSFSQAAKKLFLTQPALSLSIKKMEAELQVLLFENDKRGAILTQKGTLIFAEINGFLTDYHKMMVALKNIATGQAYIRMGVSSLLSNDLFPILSTAFTQKYPDSQLLPQETSISQQFEKLDKNEFDLILTIFPENIDSNDYNHIKLSNSSPLLFCVSIKHPLANNTTVTWEEISREKLVLLTPKFNQTAQIMREFEIRNLHPYIVHQTEQIYTVECFIEKNAACGFLPTNCIEKNPDIKGFACEGLFSKPVELIWKKNTYPSVAAKNFIKLAKELYL